MPVTFQGGQALPAVGSAAYNQAASGSGSGSYNSSTGQLSVTPSVATSTSTTSTGGSSGGGSSSGSYGTVAPNYSTGGSQANIYNTQTGQLGYQIPGAPIPSGWSVLPQGKTGTIADRNPLTAGGTTPTNTSQVTTGAPAYVAPPMNYGNINNTGQSTAYTAGQAATLAQTQADQKAITDAQTAANTVKANNNTSLATLLGANQVTPGANLTTAENNSGAQNFMNEKIAAQAEATSLQGQLAALEDSVSQQQSKFASGTETDFANNMNAQIQRNAQPAIDDMQAQVNTNAAKIAYLNEDYTQAEASAQKAADAMTQSQQNYVTYLTNMNTIANQNEDLLTAPQIAALNDNLTLANTTLTTANDQAKQVVTWSTDPAFAGAGIQYNTPYDKAVTLIQAWNNNPKNPAVIKTKAEAQTALNTANLGTPGASGATYVSGTNPQADSLIAGIKSGTMKLSDITAADLKRTPNLKSLVEQGLGASGGAQSQLLTTSLQSVRELNDMVTNDQGFTSAVGNSWTKIGANLNFTASKTKDGYVVGSPAADFVAKMKQTIQDTVLPNLNILHGLGRVTATEFSSLQSAITSLSADTSQEQFKSDLKDITDNLNRIQSNQTSTSAVTSGTLDSGITFKVIK